MSETGTRKIMALSFIFLIGFLPFTTSTEIVIERGRKNKDFDRIIWDGDCNKINGVSFMSDEEKICACRKRIKMNGITTNLFGTLYPDDNGFVTCSYNYKESGSNVFLQPYFSRDSHVVNDDSFGRAYEISDNVDALHGVEFNRNMNISIKELQLYTFKKEEPFKKISNNIFSLVNYIRSRTKHRYNLKVNTRVTRKFRGHLIQILFDRFDEASNETSLLGYTVVKFVGDREYDLQIPQIASTSLEREVPMQNKDKYKDVTIALAVIAGILLVINVLLIARGCYWQRRKKHQEAKIIAVGIKDTPDKRTERPVPKTFQEYKNLDQVEKNNYNQLDGYIMANDSTNPNNVSKEEPIYESYDQVDINSNSSNKDAQITSEYYNDDYCTFTDKEK